MVSRLSLTLLSVAVLFASIFARTVAAQDKTADPLAAYRAAAIEKWEADIVKLEKQDQEEKYPEDAILFIGSSSVRLWKELASDMAPRPAINRGYGGAKFSDLAVFVDRIVAPHPCKAVVVFVANDISGKPDDKSPDEVTRLFKYIVSRIRVTHPTAPIFLIAITPTPSRFHVWQQIKAANAALEQVCQDDRSLHFIATESSYLNEEGKPIDGYFVEDKLHQNRDGYRVWAKLVRDKLDAVLGPAVEKK